MWDFKIPCDLKTRTENGVNVMGFIKREPDGSASRKKALVEKKPPRNIERLKEQKVVQSNQGKHLQSQESNNLLTKTL